MPNILITSDDGPKATGLKVLREAVDKVWQGSKPVTIVTSEPRPGTSMACTPGWETWRSAKATQIEPRTFCLPLTPGDCIYRAFHQREEFSNRDWDLVLVGVNHGANLGFDVFHSGTTMAAMLAATGFGCPSFAFSQHIEDPALFSEADVPKHLFATAEQVLPDFLRKQSGDTGTCQSVNFPAKPAKGYKDCRTAHYSFHRTPPTKLVPRARHEQSDITYLAEGFVTVSELVLRTHPAQKY